eukprot:TRINITY_DN42110_c0_g1_i1.p1 TRINITY_DN42110_c0_g1~~TRINITY_DN42110_c0_g1_i1.p1  ORF type:complete len:120 (-),score=17.57 TRINITY_DN42110_c0_g1_i1:352-711(-)
MGRHACRRQVQDVPEQAHEISIPIHLLDGTFLCVSLPSTSKVRALASRAGRQLKLDAKTCLQLTSASHVLLDRLPVTSIGDETLFGVIKEVDNSPNVSCGDVLFYGRCKQQDGCMICRR